jgi:hypothetical protein
VKRAMLALSIVAALTMMLGSTAFAAGPKQTGATVIDVDTCVPLIGGGTVCITAKGMINEVSTPSGNASYVTNYRESLTVIEDGEVTWHETSKEHFHSLTHDDVLKELSSRSRFTITSFGQTYCVQYHIHGANGADQFVRIDFC